MLEENNWVFSRIIRADLVQFSYYAIYVLQWFDLRNSKKYLHTCKVFFFLLEFCIM